MEVRDNAITGWVRPSDLAVDSAALPPSSPLARSAVHELEGTYANGAIPVAALCRLPWNPEVLLACAAAADLTALDAAFMARYGRHLPVGGGYRDLAGQVAARAHRGAMAALPGTSHHGWGEAIDLSLGDFPGGATGDAYRWLVAVGPSYGWALPDWAAPGGSKPEPWHLEHVD